MTTFPVLAFDGIAGGTDRNSSLVDIGNMPYVSVHLRWSGLTGTIDGTIAVETSNNGGVSWVPKGDTPVIATLAGASGDEMISLNGVMSEAAVRLVYEANGVTGGLIYAHVHAKGGRA